MTSTQATRSLHIAAVACIFAAPAAVAAPTSYPLTIENCGESLTFESAPQKAVALGQNSAEIMLLLGLEDRMAATAFWPNKVLPELAEANEKVELLTVEFPTLESVLATEPDFVAAQLPTLLGNDSKVAKRSDFHDLGIPSYLSPSACSTLQNTGDAYGSRESLWNMELMYQEIDELSRIFDVADRGQALIADFRAREAALRETFGRNDDLTFLFWFSSPSPSDDAYLGGGNGPSGYIADILGGRNAIETETEWPTVGWEGIIAADPTVFVVAQVDRNRWDLDTAANKRDFLTNDPTVSQLDAVREGRIIEMRGAAMNPGIQTLYGAEEVGRELEKLLPAKE
ncbi:ABC transporter substrate-binding protein (plasmid) [Paracoccus versutus]|uniref:Iron complex transport system substrate-binding protein n=1 Tax=Paracoccus versutus TaxID=34007 RepID=A0AAQ0HMN0_PARVE|nr:ABC transporter substrate-binding protein [Paracoccus versutus]KGJ10150.1 ABC transporter substrate-binding protein [Paracoccus versutus]REG55907.1 iron complex transport system substrate-binding protein [Paracoccus versutus]WEJ81475.1 ABC transporter substrate-binding protein [Paracoccus versutus]